MSKRLPLSLVLKFLSEHLAEVAAEDRRMMAATLTHLAECPHKYEQVSAMMEVLLRTEFSLRNFAPALSDVQKKPLSATVHAISSARKKIANGAEA